MEELEEKLSELSLTNIDNSTFNCQLRELLNRDNVNHQEEINKLNNLKDAHIYCKINNINGSSLPY